MTAVENITIPLGADLLSSIASIEETLNNAVAAYAVKNRLCLEEVAAYYRGARLTGIRGEKVAMYQLCQRKVEYAVLQGIKKRAASKK